MIRKNLQSDPVIHWASLKQGNESALESLYNLYSNSLYNYGAKFTSDKELVKDCIQELFVTLWTRRNKLNIPADVKNYLFKAFRLSIFKKNALVQHNISYQDTEAFNFEITLSTEDLIIIGEQKAQLKDKLQRAVSSLTARQQEAIFLKFHENMSYEEISMVMNISVKASYKLMARSLSFLRSHLEKDDLLLLFFILNCKLFN